MASTVKIPHALPPQNGKIVFKAHEFNPKTDMVINYLTQESIKKLTNSQFTIFVNNNYANEHKFNKNVYFAINKFQIINTPSYPYNEKTSQFYPKGEDDPKRAFFKMYINEEDKNCLKMKQLFVNLDKYFQSEEFKLKFFEGFGYNEKTKEKYDLEYYQIYHPPNDDEPTEDNKNQFSKYGSIKIKFDVQTKDYSDSKNPKELEQPKIKTIIYKIDEATNERTQCNITTFKDIENLIHKNAVINCIIRLQKCYCSKPQNKNGKKKITYGFSPIFDQIIIYNSGDTYLSGNREFFDMDEGEDESNVNVSGVIKPEYPKKKNQPTNVTDEPEDDDNVNEEETEENNEDENNEEENEDENNEEENEDESNGDDNNEDDNNGEENNEDETEEHEDTESEEKTKSKSKEVKNKGNVIKKQVYSKNR